MLTHFEVKCYSLGIFFALVHPHCLSGGHSILYSLSTIVAYLECVLDIIPFLTFMGISFPWVSAGGFVLVAFLTSQRSLVHWFCVALKNMVDCFFSFALSASLFPLICISLYPLFLTLTSSFCSSLLQTSLCGALSRSPVGRVGLTVPPAPAAARLGQPWLLLLFPGWLHAFQGLLAVCLGFSCTRSAACCIDADLPHACGVGLTSRAGSLHLTLLSVLSPLVSTVIARLASEHSGMPPHTATTISWNNGGKKGAERGLALPETAWVSKRRGTMTETAWPCSDVTDGNPTSGTVCRELRSGTKSERMALTQDRKI